MTLSEGATWEKIRELASRFQKADRIVVRMPMWNFSFPYKLKQLIDLVCQRDMLFTFDGKGYGPALNIDRAFVAYVRGQSEEAGFQTVPLPGFEYVAKYVEFWLHFIGVRSITTMTVEHTWDGRAIRHDRRGGRSRRQSWRSSFESCEVRQICTAIISSGRRFKSSASPCA